MSIDVPVPIAAACLGWTPSKVRVQLRRGLVDFGTAYQSKQNYIYTIFSHKLAAVCDVPESEIEARVTEWRARFKRGRGSGE